MQNTVNGSGYKIPGDFQRRFDAFPEPNPTIAKPLAFISKQSKCRDNTGDTHDSPSEWCG